MSELQKYMPYPDDKGGIELLSLETADGIAPRQAVYLAHEVDARLAAEAERITHLCERLEIVNRRLSVMQAKYESEED